MAAVQDGRRGPRHDVLYLAQMTDEFIRMLIGCSRIRPGKAPISNVMKWSADGGIDLLSSDLDELAQYVAQILSALNFGGGWKYCKYSYVQIKVCLSPCRPRSGEWSTYVFFVPGLRYPFFSWSPLCST